MLLLRCAARSARARPLGASHGVTVTSSPAANALAFSTRAETTARNAADVRDLLRTRLSMTDADLDRVERYQPAGARATVEPKLQWLRVRLDLDAAQLRKIVLTHAPLLRRSVESMESNCDWLQRRLGLDEAHLRKMILRNPSLLWFSVEDNLAPTLDWLQTRLDTDDAELKKMVLTLPPLLSYSVGDKLAPTLDWLQTRLDLDAAQLRKVVGCPSVLSTRIDTLESKLEWLQTRLGLDAAQLKKVVLGTPLLSLSVEENLAPKLEFLAREIGLSCAELRDWVVKNPTLLGYSLANRYRPRLEACRAAGVDEKRVLSYATQTDETFCKCMGIEPGALVAARENVLSV